MPHAGHGHARIFVVDPSYTDYWDVACATSATRTGKDILLAITQSWDATTPPDGSTPWGWVRRLFYRPASHTWLFRVHPDGSVVTLPERGKRLPQSYAH